MAIFNWQDVEILAQSGTEFLDLTKYTTNLTLRPARTLVSRDLAGRKTMWRAAVESYIEASIEGYVLQNENPKFSDFFASGDEVLFMVRFPSKRMFVFRAFVNTDTILDNGGIQEMSQPLMITKGYMTGLSYDTATQGSVDFSFPANASLFVRVKTAQPADLTALLNTANINPIPMAVGISLWDVNNASPQATGDMRMQQGGTNVATGEVQWLVGGFN